MRRWPRRVVSGGVGVCAIAVVVVTVAPSCATHQCDTTSYDYYGGRMSTPTTYETSAWDEPWISYNGNVTVNIHFPPGVYRFPQTISGYVGTSPTPNGGADFMGGQNLSPAAGQLAEEYFIGPSGFSVANASCASYFARFEVTFPPVAFTLFGGLNGGGDAGVRPLGDTWTWNGSQWTAAPLVGGAPNPPSARYGMTVAVAGGSPFFFGGAEGYGPGVSSVVYDNDFWQWDGIEWAPKFWPCVGADVPPKCIPPIPTGRAYATFVTLPGRPRGDAGVADEIVMFGGVGHVHADGTFDPSDVALDDTWIWDGTSWNQQSPLHSPPARWGAAAAALNGGVVVLGGTSDGKTPLGDMWLWDDDARDWRSISPTGPSPSPRLLAAAGAIGNSVVVFGGTDGVQDFGDTWLWDGTVWTQALGPGPSPRWSAGIGAFDVPSPSLLLFGGFSESAATAGFANAALEDFWSWNGATWQEIPQSGDSFPSPRGAAAVGAH
jgi:hypothetical protein